MVTSRERLRVEPLNRIVMLKVSRYSLQYFKRAYSTSFRYTKDHEWIQVMTGEISSSSSFASVAPVVGRVGVTNYAQKALGDLVYVELAKKNTQLTKGSPIGVVESVKGASDIYSPVSGRIIAVNEAVIKKPSLINKHPEAEGIKMLCSYKFVGWLCEIEVDNANECESLMDGKQYEAFCKGQQTCAV